tara:strand:- start:488 stop:859 length:372 start_codon:yes stop_codon:yes gene_type:complete
MYRSHPLFFSGPDIQGGLSIEDRQSLLEQENLLAEERDAKAREFQLQMERERKAQESEMAELAKRQEAERISEVEAQERAAAGFADPEVDAARADRERRITNMWGSLAAGQDQSSATDNVRPE